MTTREAEAADAERIHELAESAMTTSYALSPEQITEITEEQFSDDAIERKVDTSDTVLVVAEDDGTVVGVAEGDIGEGRGEVRWVFVDPERRGAGHGTALFEELVDELDERGARSVQAVTLDANQEGREFFEQFGFAQTDTRETELGSETLKEIVHVDESEVDEDDPADAEDAAGGEGEGADAEAETEVGETVFPDDGTATTADGTTVYLSEDDSETGTDAPFYVTYTDEDREEQYGYYCGNCGSTETAMGDMEQIECQDCGNVHEPKGSEQYDEGYL